MLSGVSVICFASCYAIALALEIVGLKVRFRWHRVVLLAVTVAGLAAHTIYLGYHAADDVEALSSPAGWLLLAAWLLALLYVAASLYVPRTATGLLMLPIVLALVAMSHWASREPLSAERAFRFWGAAHSAVLLLGTVTVCVGFLAGVMYLIQSVSLKRGWSPTGGLRLPSLEWLEKINSRSLAVSALLIGLGFASGVILSGLKHRGDEAYVPWSDPVVVTLAAMLTWLVAAEVFRLIYPEARRGRKVAYLTLAAFVFLVITLASLTFLDSAHGQPARETAAYADPLHERSKQETLNGSSLVAEIASSETTRRHE